MPHELDLALDNLTMAEGTAATKKAYEALDNEGVLIIRAFAFHQFIKKYLSDHVTSQGLWDLLMVPPKQAFWDENTIATMMLRAGFYKVHTQTNPDNVDEMWAIGLKFKVPDY